MTAYPNFLTEGLRLTRMSWPELVGVAKVQPALAPILLSRIEIEAIDEGQCEWAEAARYALDNLPADPRGCYDELDGLIADGDRVERTLTAASYCPGNELPVDVFFSITGEAA